MKKRTNKEEEKAFKKKQKRKHKHGHDFEDSDEKDANDSDTNIGNNEVKELCLFYRIFKIMLSRDPITKRYISIL